MSILEISLLGTPIIQLDHQPVVFESRKATALLAFLAIEGEPRQRSELATLLWPDSDTKRARGALRYTLSIMQRALGKEWLESDRDTIALVQHERCVADVVRFQSLLEPGRDHMHPPDTACLDCIDELNAAVALYRDDFLTGFGLRDSVNFDEWQFFQVEGFRHQLANILRVLIRYHTQQADYHQALASARRLLQLDPLQESVQRKAMQLYAHSGQWELALHQYEACTDLLEQELGVPPSPATTQLYEEIRSRKLGDTALPDQATDGSTAKSTGSKSTGSKSTGSKSTGSTSIAQPARPHNLPSAAMPILGRAQELAEIRGLLEDPHCRMVTLLGPGGIGKTRLAHQIAIDLCNAPEVHFADEIYFVSLAAIETTELLVAAIANALTLSFSGAKTPKEQLYQYLYEKRMLLVLDNFEQLVISAPLLTDLLNAASGIKLLITSRERLNLHEEWLFEIQGLPLPPPIAVSAEMTGATAEADTRAKADVTVEADARADADVEAKIAIEAEANGAVQLYYQRARRLDPRFVLADSLPAIVQICRLLQGMPLGIELAAGWVRTFSSAEIVRQIQQDLDFLATPSQNVPARHRSLRAAFLHSWRGLTEEERVVFAKATIFRGGFSLEAATTVIKASPLILSTLVDKSMVKRVASSIAQRQPDRYNIHELLRQYAEETLEPEERNTTAQQHCNYFAAFVEKRRHHLGLVSEDHALREISDELDNIRGAWRWLVEQIRVDTDKTIQPQLADTAGQFVPMLAHYYLRFSRYEEGQQLLLMLIKAMQAAGWATAGWATSGEDGFDQRRGFRLAQVEARLAEFAFNLSRFHEVADTYTRLLPLFRQAEVPSEIGSALAGLGKTLIRMGRYPEAEPLLHESLEIFRTTSEMVGITAALNNLGILYSNQGRFEEARPYYEEFLATARANHHIRGMANALNNLGSNYARAGQHQKALPFYEESHRLSLQSGERLVIAVALSNLGSVSRALGQFVESRRYYAESLAICREIGERRWTVAGLNGLGLTLIDDQTPEEAFPYLQEALSIAQEIESLPDILDALSAIGDVLFKRGELKQAAPILHFVANHPVTQTLSRQRSQALLAGVGLDDAKNEGLALEEVVGLVSA